MSALDELLSGSMMHAVDEDRRDEYAELCETAKSELAAVYAKARSDVRAVKARRAEIARERDAGAKRVRLQAQLLARWLTCWNEGDGPTPLLRERTAAVLRGEEPR